MHQDLIRVLKLKEFGDTRTEDLRPNQGSLDKDAQGTRDQEEQLHNIDPELEDRKDEALDEQQDLVKELEEERDVTTKVL